MAPTKGKNNPLNINEGRPSVYINDLDSPNPTQSKKLRRCPSRNIAIACRQQDAKESDYEFESDHLQHKLEDGNLSEDVDNGGLLEWKIEPQPVTEIESLCGHDVVGTSDDLTTTGDSLGKNSHKHGEKRKKSHPKKKMRKRLRKDSTPEERLPTILPKTQAETEALTSQNMTINTEKPTKAVTGHGSGTHKEKGGCVKTKQSAPVATGTGCLPPGKSNHGGGGGGGGDEDDGDDGNKKPPRKLPEETKCGGKVAKPRKKKNDSEENSSDAMDMDSAKSPIRGSNSSDKMHVDTRSDVEMESAENVASPPGQPLNQQQEVTQRLQMEVLTQNANLQHRNFCDKEKCDRCVQVKDLLQHITERNASCCCLYCKLWPFVKNYHTGMCAFHECKVCNKTGNASPAARVVAVRQNILPTAQRSLDEKDVVVWKCKQIGDNMTHFKENENYRLLNSVVGKGAHGAVCDVEISEVVKQKYANLFYRELVMKEVKEFGEDEKFVFENTWRHPNFVHTYLVTKMSLKHRIFMEKCDTSLKDYLIKLTREGKALEISEAMLYWTQIADAVKYLHYTLMVMHKDIKAENVLLSKVDEYLLVKLADFDTVKILHDSYTQPGLRPKGTPGLIAPEVLRCEPHGRPADAYNLAMFLMQLLFLQAFQHLQCLLHKKDIPTQLSLMRDFLKVYLPQLKNIDLRLGDLIEKCFDMDPRKRPTVRELLDSQAVKKYVKIEQRATLGNHPSSNHHFHAEGELWH